MTKRQTQSKASAKTASTPSREVVATKNAGEKTSAKVASVASRALKDPKSITAKEAKSVAASALTQANAKSYAARATTARGPAGFTPAVKAPAAKTAARLASVAFVPSEAIRTLKTQPPAKAFSFRMDESTVGLIDQAAEVTGQTRTEFVLASARKRATDVLLDQTLFRLSDADWEAFRRALDEPAAPNEELKKFLAGKSPWEE